MRPPSPHRRLAIVGRGRLGHTLARMLRAAGHEVRGPLGRGYAPAELGDPEIVLLCVPDHQIPAAAAVLAERHTPTGPAELLVGHCSGATGLAALGRTEALSVHPLMSVSGEDDTASPRWDGAVAAVAGSTERALAAAHQLARDLGLRPVAVSDADRAAYHAAASIASNFLVTLEDAAASLAATAGVDRELLLPLVRQTVENWGAQGPTALTGPIARGDEATVGAQRAAVAERTPELLELFDALAAATRRLAGGRALAEASS